MRVRKTDEAGDMVFGGSQAAYWRDVPDGVAQIVKSRLHLWTGEWYLDLAEGTPYDTQVLGKFTESTRDAVLQARILDTPGVVGIVSYDSTLDRETRGFAVAATIETEFGRAALQGRAASTANVMASVRVAR